MSTHPLLWAACHHWSLCPALVVYIPVPVVWQLYLQSLFNIAHAADGTYIPGLTFLQDSEHALWALGASSILVIIGLWLIKTNFLVLFHRLGSNIPKYLWAWWACSFLVMACGIVALGLNEYECMFGRAQDIVQRCMTLEKRARMFYQGVAAAVLDAFSDLLLIIFPSWVLWNTRFSIRQKIVFSAVFALVGLTISMAVIRGSTSRSNIDDPKVARKQVNIAWIFWFAVEYLTYITRFLIHGCSSCPRGTAPHATVIKHQEREALSIL
ncbi:hypothetical protein B0T26DRAFT_739211 [Lasiosphaeria miniovina]|uniref:Rhodopsin domain-containing protein n=1 Tax=Lasiosphaeria miniovina TaxID=1954250 RepID=A0AA40ATM8_9PEZI|nr:uncharacterized protein B0T26DRAFT_739211 [Lasiosphaeria miniovina]KAK0721778.1 hypothetical protein B0T26DRAFT_739211 [Lasiosphaeria miniovina]